ncbi:MAG: 5-oxoprolinase subunit B family protein [Burkholderiaceae bacterium]
MNAPAAATPRQPVFRAVSDHALLVEFGSEIQGPVHDAVLRLDQALQRKPFEGLVEAVPAYVNLLVIFDPLVRDFDEVQAHLMELLDAPAAVRRNRSTREVLVCYDGDFAPDLDAVAERTGLSREAVIEAHLSGRYQVFMYGFAPGYAYLGGVPEAIRMERKPSPVRNISAGSVLIAGPQCLVTTLVMPTGWWIIGRSPTGFMSSENDDAGDSGSGTNVRADAARAFLFGVGDAVVFRRISRSEFDAASR